MDNKVISIEEYKLEKAYRELHKERVKLGLKQGYTYTIKAN